MAVAKGARTILAIILLLTVFPNLAHDATSSYQTHVPIVIRGNGDFTSLKGVTSGSGTISNPYVIEGWEISASSSNAISIVNTTVFFTIRNVNLHSGIIGVLMDNVTNGLVQSSLISDNGEGVFVHSSSHVAISSNNLSNNSVSVRVDHSTKIFVSGNIVSENQKGILAISSSGVTVSANMITSSIAINFGTLPGLPYLLSPGIFLDSSLNSTISGNIVSLSFHFPPLATTGNPNFLHAVLLNNSANILVSGNALSSLGGDGINLISSPRATMVGNNITKSHKGVSLFDSPYSIVSNNNISKNSDDGIFLSYSDNATLTDNIISSNDGYGISCCGKNTIVKRNVLTLNGLLLRSLDFSQPLTPYYSSLSITPDNLVNGKPILLYKNCANLTIDGVSAGELIVANCGNVLVKNVQIAYADIGIQLLDTNNARITNNVANSNTHIGISVSASPPSGTAVNITIVNNNLSNNGWLFSPAEGIVAYATPLVAYHNNLLYDVAADYYYWRGNSWDNGYPSGGNYWSLYTGIDNCTGPSQNICPAPDGLGDTPFRFFNISNALVRPHDQYPLMRPFLPAPDTTPPSWPLSIPLAVSSVNPTNLTLAWIPALDDVGVASYRIYRGSTLLATVPADQLTYTITGLNPNTTYTFSIQAVDWTGNQSATGLSTTVTTPSQTAPPVLSPYGYVIAVLVATVASILALRWFLKKRRVRAENGESALK